MSFGSPLLLASLVVPLLALAGYIWIERRPLREGIVFPNLAVLASVAGRSSWKRHLVAGLLLVTIALLCVAVARPRLSLAATSDRATVVLVVDVSVSMNATDVAPNRLDAARAAITSFADKVPGRVKVGLVAFDDDPVVVTTPTTDRKLLKEGIASLTPGFGTAIGDAVARGVELVQLATGENIPVAGESVDGAPLDLGEPLGAVVLLSDGSQTRGVLEPDEGARLAQRAGVPVYTIALGTLAGTVTIYPGRRGDRGPGSSRPRDPCPDRREHGGVHLRGQGRRRAGCRVRPARPCRRPDREAAGGERCVRRRRSGPARRRDRPRGPLGAPASLTQGPLATASPA